MKKILIALIVLTACGASVFAGEMKNDGSVVLGYAMPVGDASDIVKGGVGAGLEYDGYKIDNMFTLGGSFFYTSSTGKSDAKYAGITYDMSNVTWSTWGLTPYVKASKEVNLGGDKVNVYGLIGLGVYNSAGKVGGISSSSTDFGFNIGGGIMYPLADKMNLGFDLKYHDIMASDVTWSYLVPAVKFTYSF